jgi:hypothetical protein
MRGTPSICMTDSPGGAALIEPGAARAAGAPPPQAIQPWRYAIRHLLPLRRHRVLRVGLNGAEAGRHGERRAGVAGGVGRAIRDKRSAISAPLRRHGVLRVRLDRSEAGRHREGRAGVAGSVGRGAGRGDGRAVGGDAHGQSVLLSARLSELAGLYFNGTAGRRFSRCVRGST